MRFSSRQMLALLPPLAILAGCTLAQMARSPLPCEYTIQRDQLIFHTDFPLPREHRLIEELAARRGDLERLLNLSIPGEPIQVYLFENREQFNEYLQLYHPDFPHRRAFFFETDTRLAVFAQWGDRVAEDLRHEVTHGYLHAAISNLPLWLDEGLAKYAEAPRGRHGMNRPYVEQLLHRLEQTNWQPNLVRLETFEPTRDMSQEDYAESWAWVHFLLEGGPQCQGVLQEFVAQLRRDGSASPVSDRLARLLGHPERALVDHLQNLGTVQ
ncbi:MAG: peptidase MA family metallohydrolase [Thermoguttaceae bacterium]